MSDTIQNASVQAESTAPVESKLHLKINEDPKNVDFTFMVPNNCSWEFAKRAIMGTFEQIVKLEVEDVRVKAEQAAKEAQLSPEPVEAEVIS
jgi:hypothetical protein